MLTLFEKKYIFKYFREKRKHSLGKFTNVDFYFVGYKQISPDLKEL